MGSGRARTACWLANLLLIVSAGCTPRPDVARDRQHTRSAQGLSASVRPRQADQQPRARGRPAREMVRTVWPVGTDAIWAWTEADTVGGREHIWFSRDAGARWTDATPASLAVQTRSRRINQLFVLDRKHAWLTTGRLTSGGRATVWSTSDSGRHWLPRTHTPSANCRLDFVSPSHGWCVLDRAAMGRDAVKFFATHDGGTTWQAMKINGLPAFCDKNVQFSTTTVGWAVTACVADTPPIYRTRDGGVHWASERVVPPGHDPNSGGEFDGVPVVGPSGRGVLAFEGTRTLMYASRDAGKSWRPTRVPGRSAHWSAATPSPATWILIHGRRLLRTRDGGRTWARTLMDHRFGEIVVGYNQAAPGIYFATADTGWVTGFRSGHLWRSTTGGRTWTRIEIPTTGARG